MELFDNISHEWEDRYKMPFYVDRLQVLKKWVEQRQLSLKDKVLDLGCGTASSFDVYQEFNLDPHGIDVSEKMVEECAALNRPNVSVFNGEEIPYSDNTFLGINMFNVIEFVQKPQDLFNEIYRVLKPGGGLLLTVVNHDAILRKLLRLKHGIKREEYLPSEWVNYFDLHHIKQIAEDSGFCVPRVFQYSYPYYDKLFTRMPKTFMPLIRNGLFCDSIYIECFKSDGLT